MSRIIKTFVVLFLIAFLGIQFLEVDQTNPPVEADIEAPSNIKAIFKKSCYDCHSNETKWPWYSKVAPVSWMISDHVNKGRKQLNFSMWEKYYTADQRRLKEEILEEILNENMPLKNYTFLHPNSILTIDKKNLIKDWAGTRSFVK